jgi:hypothetical protein
MLASPRTLLYIHEHSANVVRELLVNISSAVQNLPSTWSTPTPLLRLSTLRNLWFSCVLIVVFTIISIVTMASRYHA